MSRRFWMSWEALLLAMLLALIAIGWATSDVFGQGSTITLITTNSMEKALMALPMTLIIISGGIDLSVGSIFAWSAVMLGFSWQLLGFPLPLAVLVCLLTGAVAGLINGAVIA